MEMYILDPKGDIIFVLKNPNQQRILIEAPIPWPTKSSKKSTGHSRQANFALFDENPFQTPVVDVKATPLSIDTSAVTSATDESDRLYAGANADGTTLIDSESPCFSKPKECRFRVSSSHLRLASPILEGMLDGKYPEKSLEEIITAEDGSKCRLLYTSEWDEKVFLILMNWIHGRHREVPKQVDLEMLGKFSILVDYYKCQEITAMLGETWINTLQDILPTAYCQSSILWIFISWVFSTERIFTKMTELALKQSSTQVDMAGLPFPSALVNDIEVRKRGVLGEISDLLRSLYIKLQSGEALCKGSYADACSSMLLGALVKAMSGKGITDKPGAISFAGCSLEEARQAVLAFKSPRWNSPADHDTHRCTLKSMLEPDIKRIWSSLVGMKMRDYPFYSPHTILDSSTLSGAQYSS